MDNWRQSSMDWQEFQKSLLKQIPFMGDKLNMKGIEDFIHKAIKHHLPKSFSSVPNFSNFSPFFSSVLDYEIFETHRSIFVRCTIPDEFSPRDLRFFINRRILKIEHPAGTREISLPADVNPDRTFAKYRGGMLEIRLPKTGESEPFREIFIRDGGK